MNRYGATASLEISPLRRLEEAVLSHINRSCSEEEANRLRELFEIYTAAGRTAVSQYQQPNPWLYFKLYIPDRDPMSVLSDHVSQAIEKLGRTFPVKGWWWLTKADSSGPHCRIRVAFASGHSSELAVQVNELLGTEFRTAFIPYEPELSLFGGETGLDYAHEYFMKDSDFLVQWYQLNNGRLKGMQGISLYLAHYLMKSCELDVFERHGVWELLRKHRNMMPVRGDTGQLLEWAKKIIRLEPESLISLHSSRAGEVLERYLRYIRCFGERLSHAYQTGRLECGLRQYLSALLIFHWNRAGLYYQEQTSLISAMLEYGRDDG
ncbi:hypothetical protein FLT15_07770 [Paenibacillus thiaminolyticus]|uniref:thiopeptide-type bacteriocin biosynthesis protein n=1 Tax=Paenibacillus thiaminolyticus TaxID=49283 RepID=UPI001164337D|nr:thiopeptide-type bacteriocin biosynthesis protein [Paenibacillus thiaminolyticus]NGP58289.1 hypothetical protein [Paenibacillus thiaminolyticus]